MKKEIRVYVHGVKDGEKWRQRYIYPSHYKVATCLKMSGGNPEKVKAVGTEEGTLVLHVEANPRRKVYVSPS